MARAHGDDLRGASRLAVDATTGVTALVEAMHRTIASGPTILGRPLGGPARLVTGVVYGAIRGVTRVVGGALDAALAALAPLLGEGTPGPQRTAVQAALNGVIGDHLATTGNPLALELALTPVGPQRPHLIVLIHGLAMHPGQWKRNGHDHGAELAAALGATAVYAHYNSGRHISTNGAELARALDELVASWPMPVASIALIGHSMGGLVARSACEAARVAHLPWLRQLRALVTLGTPHHGAPLERGGAWIDALLGVSAYSAPLRMLARIRSAGITDLRHGNLLDAHWDSGDRFALTSDRRTAVSLPDGVACFAIAATAAAGPGPRLPGDGLVPVASALGDHDRAALALGVPAGRRFIAYGADHLDLLDRPAVFAQLRWWLAALRAT